MTDSSHTNARPPSAPSIASSRRNGVSFVVAPEASTLRADVGATSWLVLETLLATADRCPEGGLVAPTSVRRLAGCLGISKDTAASAVRRLAARGLVDRLAAGRRPDGTFASEGGYRINLSGIVGLSVVEERRTASARSAQRRASGAEQPALFDLTGGEVE
jgi:hypothetical protein